MRIPVGPMRSWVRPVVFVAGLVAAVLLALAQITPARATMVLEREVLCSDAAYQDEPDVASPWAVWSDRRNGTWDIYALNTETRVERPVCTATGDQTHPRIWGTWVVWQDRRSGSWNIYACDLATDTEVAVCTAAGAQVAPRIEAGAIVWQDDRASNWDLYGSEVADLPGAPAAIVAGSADQTAPDLSSGWLVWVDDRAGNLDIWALDRSSPAAVPAAFTSSGARQDEPAVAGDLVVWRDFRHLSAGTGTDLYAGRLGADLTWELIGATGDQETPAIAEDVVVYTDYRRMAAGHTLYGPDISAFDMSLQEAVTVYSGAAAQNKPAIAGSNAAGFEVVWADWRSRTRKTNPWWARVSPWTARIAVNDGAFWVRDPVVDLSLYAATNNPGAAIAEMDVVDVGDPAAVTVLPYATAVNGWDLTWPGHDADGVYRVAVVYRDDSGLPRPTSEAPQATATVKLDRGRPLTRAPSSATTVAGGTATLRFRVDDAMSPSARVTITVKTLRGATKKTLTPGWVKTGKLLVTRFACRLAPGAYRFFVSARDRAGWTDLSSASNRLIVR